MLRATQVALQLSLIIVKEAVRKYSNSLIGLYKY